MNERHQEPFESLEPPRGGLARLRDRIEQRRRQARTRRASLAAAALLVAGGAGWLLVDRPGPGPTRLAGDPFRLARISLGLAAPPAEPLTIRPASRHRAAARRVPLADERVVFYRIETVD